MPNMITPNDSQQAALASFQEMLSNPASPIMLMTGAAGTGKTTMIQYMVNWAKEQGYDTQCLAYTNQAATNITRRIQLEANTIHAYIYDVEEEDDKIICHRKEVTPRSKCLYIIDEISMIPCEKTKGNFQTPGSLFADLVQHCKEEAEDCKILLVGDPNQLPPVNGEAKAFIPDFIRSTWDEPCELVTAHLSKVMRQDGDSPILKSAYACLDAMAQHASFYPPTGLDQLRYPQVFRDLAHAAESPELELTGISLCTTNREVNFINGEVRSALGRQKDRLSIGDHLSSSEGSFLEDRILFKGTNLVVTAADDEVKKWGGCRFQSIRAMADMKGMDGDFPLLVNLDFLFSENCKLGNEVERALKHEAMRTNPDYRQFLKNKYDIHLNAARLRFRYSMTTHKAQGQEFPKVYIVPPWMDKQTDLYKYQHLYTSITRGSDYVAYFKVYPRRAS